ncbi:hypothetical protein C8Q76DRAFT_607138, partial [Earliella scabrosa]
MAWRQTSRAYYTVVATVLRARYTACVSPFVIDVEHFSELLRASGAIISGSAALHFFHPDLHWQPLDLDIYVSERMFHTFIATVAKDEQLRFQLLPAVSGSGRSSIAGGNGIRDVFRFRTPTGRHVDIVRSSTSNPVTPLRAFWTTLVMNFLTPDGCVCGYPGGTMARHGFIR